jgi:hypothetical protein
MKTETTLGLVILAVVLIAVGVGPLITIWSLNTLFMAGSIAYTFKTWLAALLLQMTLAGLIKSGVSK